MQRRFTFAIVPHASPIQPVATSKLGTDTGRDHSSSHVLGALRILRWYPSSLASICKCNCPCLARACPMPCIPTSISQHQSFGDATQQSTCANAQFTNSECYLASIALSSRFRSRQVSSGKAPFRQAWLAGARSRFSRMRRMRAT